MVTIFCDHPSKCCDAYIIHILVFKLCARFTLTDYHLHKMNDVCFDSCSVYDSSHFRFSTSFSFFWNSTRFRNCFLNGNQWKPMETYFHFENLNKIPNGVCFQMRMLVIGFQTNGIRIFSLPQHNWSFGSFHSLFTLVITCDMLMDHLSSSWIEHLFFFFIFWQAYMAYWFTKMN